MFILARSLLECIAGTLTLIWSIPCFFSAVAVGTTASTTTGSTSKNALGDNPDFNPIQAATFYFNQTTKDKIYMVILRNVTIEDNGKQMIFTNFRCPQGYKEHVYAPTVVSCTCPAKSEDKSYKNAPFLCTPPDKKLPNKGKLTVTFFSSIKYKGEKADVIFDNECTNLTPNQLSRRQSSLKLSLENKHCIVLYKEQYCAGEKLLVQKNIEDISKEPGGLHMFDNIASLRVSKYNSKC